jgi:hypothetical protein
MSTQSIGYLIDCVRNDVVRRDVSSFREHIRLLTQAIPSVTPRQEELSEHVAQIYAILEFFPQFRNIDEGGIYAELIELAERHWGVSAAVVAKHQGEVLSKRVEAIRQSIAIGEDAKAEQEVECLDDILFILTPIQPEAMRGVIAGLEALLQQSNAYRMHATSALLEVLRLWAGALPGPRDGRLREVIATYYPYFLEYAVCYVALELLVDVFPDEDTAVLLSDLAALSTGDGKWLIPQALSWLVEQRNIEPCVRERALRALEHEAQDKDPEYARIARAHLS